jgi:hypothetical protein
MIKRRDIALEKLPFLEKVDPLDGDLVTIPALKRKLEETQFLNLRLTEENERLEHMLKLQADINRDLHKEIESLTLSRDKDKNEMSRKASDMEQLAFNRLDKIHSLEAQLRQFIYGVTKGNKKGGKVPTLMPSSMEDHEEADEDDDRRDDLIAELLRDQGDGLGRGKGEIKPGENMLEIWIKKSDIKDGILTPGSSTFVVIDFFDYESQTTSVISGCHPEWDFAATYKINVDDFLLRFFATDVVTFELNMAAQGDFTLLGRSTIPLNSLLKSRPRIKSDNYPIISVRTGQIIASLSIDIRLAIPISELYKLFLERHPNEKRLIEEFATKRLLETSATAKGPGADLISSPATASTGFPILSHEDQDRLYNELDVIIHRVDGLSPVAVASSLRLSPERSAEFPSGEEGMNKLPTPYVHFQLLGNPDKFTHPIFHSLSPMFNEKFTFPIVTTDSSLRLLSKNKVIFSVIDLDKEEDDENGLLGEVEISCAPLHEGLTISDSFILRNRRNGEKTSSSIYLTLKWRFPLKKQHELGPNALSGIEVETLISAFSLGSAKEGIIDYSSFCKFISPSSIVIESIEMIRKFTIHLLEKEGKTIKELLNDLFSGQKLVDSELFIKSFLKYQQLQQIHKDKREESSVSSLSLSPSDLSAVFEFIDNSEDHRVTLDHLISALNIDEISGISLVLQQKLRNRNKEVASRGHQVVKIFQALDQWGTDGIITRGEFKKGLRKMGFALVDEPEITETTILSPSSRQHKQTKQGSHTQGFHFFCSLPVFSLPLFLLGSEGGSLLDDSTDNVLDHGDELLVDDENQTTIQKSELNNFMKKQRDIFDQKKEELQQQSKELLKKQYEVHENSALRDPMISSSLMVSSIDGHPAPSAVDHRTSVQRTSKPSSVSPVMDVENAATKVQSHIRGYQARKQISPVKKSVAGERHPVRQSVEEESGEDIIDVYNLISQNLKIASGSSSIVTKPNLAEGFIKVDKQHMGYVSRQQFAHVVGMFPSLQLHGTLLGVCMDYFDMHSPDGKSLIDYNAFLRFYSTVQGNHHFFLCFVFWLSFCFFPVFSRR